jgi:peptide deformylase
MLLRIIKGEASEVLRGQCEPTMLFETKANKEFLNKLAFDMIETMKANNGIGLSAPQIGISQRIIVLDAGRDYVMFNPEIIKKQGEQINEEGCLSLPDIKVKVKRPKMIKVKYYDHLFQEKTTKFRGIDAAVVCHEIDHLDGKLIIDYLPKGGSEKP